MIASLPETAAPARQNPDATQIELIGIEATVEETHIVLIGQGPPPREWVTPSGELGLPFRSAAGVQIRTSWTAFPSFLTECHTRFLMCKL